VAVEMLDDEHMPRCSCLICQSRGWLRFRPKEDAYPVGVGLKIATYGGTGGGTGEPDRALADPVCAEADFRRALALIPTEFLRTVGTLYHETAPPDRASKANPHASRAVTVMDAIAAEAWIEWNDARALGMLHGGENPTQTLHRLLDECAVEMGKAMGERMEGRPSRMRPVAVAEAPPEWEQAPANRR